MPKEAIAQSLAKCFLAGETSVEEIVRRAREMLGRRWNWLWPVARNYIKTTAGGSRLRQDEVLEFILAERAFQRAWAKYSESLRVQQCGSPTSPALANLCAYRMDCRLAGLANTAGAGYTRYADDLAFSGGPEFVRDAERFSICAAAILFEEGFSVHHRKTRIMRQGVRQHLAGLVTNERLNVRRDDFDELKAILTNCVRHRPESRNREGHAAFRAHLEGRVGFVEMVNAAKGGRLWGIFERIVW